MLLQPEVSSRLGHAKSCQALLYAPLDKPLTFRQTQRYEFEFSGSEEGLTDFVRKVLLDEVSQDLHLDGEPVFHECQFFLEYGMKPGALDLEKETILAYHRAQTASNFEITSLKIYTRLYVFNEAREATSPEPFIKDIVNPAIHVWHVTDVPSSSCA
jgi:hypothetical protein